MTKEEAKALFWDKEIGIFVSMFHRMNHENEAIKILDNGTALDKFIDKIYDELCDTYENRTCSNCKYGNEADGNVYFCIPMYDATGGVELFTLPSFGCNKWAKKEK